jgi:hypothetical protein
MDRRGREAIVRMIRDLELNRSSTYNLREGEILVGKLV